MLTDAGLVPTAEAAANAAAQQAGVVVRDLTTSTAMAEVSDLFRSVWHARAEAAPVNPELMRALVTTGNYVAGAYSGDTLVGAAVAFFTDETPRALHSHICGVASSMRSRSVGFAIKLHQRWWGLRKDVASISWTMDPLVRRNVYFNLAKLGATVSAYLPDFYGRMIDGVNAQDSSDRLLLTWPLASGRVVTAAGGTPYVPTASAKPLLVVGTRGEPVVHADVADVVSCELPADIVHLRETDPSLARSWRHALRDAIMPLLSEGFVVTGISSAGAYVLSR